MPRNRTLFVALCLSTLAPKAEGNSLLPADSRLFHCNRCSATTAADGKPGYAVEMSCEKWAELSWRPPFHGKLESVTLDIEMETAIPGTFWLRIIDKEREQFGSEKTKRIPIPPAGKPTSLAWKIDDLQRCAWSLKKDGAITYPILSVMLGYSPTPKQSGAKLVFNLRGVSAQHRHTPIPWEARMNQLDSHWRLHKRRGAEGVLTRNNDGSHTLTKTNGRGFVELRMKKPIRLAGNKLWYFRGDYHSRRTPLGALLSFRFPTTPTGDALYNSSGDMGRSMSLQSVIINSSPGEWQSYDTSLKPSDDADVYPAILLIGNPAEIKLRNLRINDRPKIRQLPPMTPAEPLASLTEVKERLARRPNATARIRFSENGNSQLLINNKPVVPTLNKNSRNTDFWRFRDFAEAGVPIVSLSVPTSHQGNRPGIARTAGDYDWELLDKLLYEALRHNPDANLCITINAYEPWLGWSQDNFDEIWQNEEGLRGYGNLVHLKAFSNDPKVVKQANMHWWPSYSSRKWHRDLAKSIGDIMRHIAGQPYGKAVVAIHVSGGDDGQFQYRKDDFSPPAQREFRAFLKQKYGTLENLNAVWKSHYKSYADIRIPARQRSAAPFQAPGRIPDYCRFQNHESWRMRQVFCHAAKQAIGKEIITSAYGQADSFLPDQFAAVPALDTVTTVIGYPYRNNAVPSGLVAPEIEYRLHRKLWFQELDLRSWNTSSYDEFVDHWQGTQTTPEAWMNMHRKLVGISLARRQGWWYYSMDYLRGRFFDAPEIMAEIKTTVKLHAQLQALPASSFQPEVCVVSGASNDFHISTRPYRSIVNLNAQGNGLPIQQFMLETSGVPYDRALLPSILSTPELQNYKVYVFLHNSFITSEQRRKIDSLLKNRGRTIVWVHATGYIDETGKSTAAMEQLTGFKIETEETYARRRALVEENAPFTTGVPPFMSFGDLKISLHDPVALRIWAVPAQSFWIGKSDKGAIIARYTDGKTAAASKRFSDWTSIFLADHSSLGNTMLNNIAKEAGVYRPGKAGHSIVMNGNFASIHPLYDDEYELRLPPGTTRATDAHSGKLLGAAPAVRLKLKVGKTLWVFFD